MGIARSQVFFLRVCVCVCMCVCVCVCVCVCFVFFLCVSWGETAGFLPNQPPQKETAPKSTKTTQKILRKPDSCSKLKWGIEFKAEFSCLNFVECSQIRTFSEEFFGLSLF